MYRLAAIAIATTLAACDRPKPLGTTPSAPPQTPAPAAENTGPESSTTPAPPAARPLAPQPPSRPVPALVADYLAQSQMEKRREILWELLGSQPAEGVAAVSQLLDTEKRASLRVELFDALDSFDGLEPAKIAILKRELLERRTVGEAHDAAIDALLNIQHRDAIPLWQALSENADDDLRDIARQAISALESLK